jgi:hypothetical protein
MTAEDPQAAALHSGKYRWLHAPDLNPRERQLLDAGGAPRTEPRDIPR